LGQGPRPGEDFRPPPGWDSGFEFGAADPAGGFGSHSDFFESLFGRAGGSQGSHAEDHHARVLLDLDASLQGGTRTLTLRLPDFNAKGRLQTRERTLNVQIPRGILPGQHIRLAGQGVQAPGSSQAGDLYIEVDFQPHRLYRIDGRDLLMTLPVSPWEAALGATVKAPTPTGPVDLKIPASSRGGSKLRLKGRGIPSSPPGDFYVLLEIALPDAGDAKTRAAYADFAAAAPFDPRAQLGV